MSRAIVVGSEKCKMQSAKCKSPICILHFAFCILQSSPLTPSPPHPVTRSPRHLLLTAFCAAVLACCLAAGCASSKMATLRPVPKNPLGETLSLTARGGPKPSERTCQFLRVYDLSDDLGGDPEKFLQKVEDVVQREPTPESVYAISESELPRRPPRRGPRPAAVADVLLGLRAPCL